MELRYPQIVIVLIIAFACYMFFAKKKKTKFEHGSKIANTSFIKNTDYYKSKMKKYSIIVKLLKGCSLVSILVSIILIGRLAKVEKLNLNEYNRDIFLCMDVSASVDELNLELVETLKNTVKSLKGERFGISIFNTSSVTLVPLTDDYDYVIDTLDTIKKSIEYNNLEVSYDDYDFYLKNYIISGTLEGNTQRGSSLIGDGLASCVYSFSNLEEDRTRIIIFTTDNALEGSPLVTLDNAAKISRQNGVKVFGIGTEFTKDESSFKEAIESTRGKYYKYSPSTTGEIVRDIEKTSKSLLDNDYITKVLDIPEIPFAILLISVTFLIILKRKVQSWELIQ